MLLNMQILYDRIRDMAADCHISDSVFLNIRNIRVYRSDKKPDWKNYVYLAEGEIAESCLTEGWESDEEKHIIFLNTEKIPERWAEEQWISLRTRESRQSVLERIQSVFEWFDDWEKRLLKAQIQKRDVREILEIAAEALPNPVVVCDSATRCLAWAGEMPEQKDALWDLVLGESIAYSAEMRQLYRKLNILNDILREKNAYIYHLADDKWPDFLMANIYDSSGQVRIGNLGATPLKEPLTAGQAGVFEYLASCLGPVVERYSKTLDDAKKKNLLNCLEGKPVNEEFFRELFASDSSGGRPVLRMFCLEKKAEEDGFPEEIEMIAAKLQRVFQEENNIYVVYLNQIAVLAAGLNTGEKVSKWLDRLQKGLETENFRVGISALFGDVKECAAYYMQARIALKYMSDDGSRLSYFRDTFYRYAADRITEKLPMKAVCHPEVYKVYLYDRKHDTEYQKTLQAYLENHCNVSQTAKAMYLHRNTVIYRLDRMKELFGDNLFSEAPGDLLFSLKLVGACASETSADERR